MCFLTQITMLIQIWVVGDFDDYDLVGNDCIGCCGHGDVLDVDEKTATSKCG